MKTEEKKEMVKAQAVTALVSASQTLFFDIEKFEHAQRVAKMLSQSTLIPEHFKNNIGNCVIALNYAERIGADPWAIEGCGTCIVFIIIMILVSLGISLPHILTQIPEALVVSVVLVIFGALWWSLVIASVPLTRRNYLNQQRAFNAAMQLGTGSSPNSEEP